MKLAAIAVGLAALAAAGGTSAQGRTTACPKAPLPFPANPIAPATVAALRADSAANRPLVTGATLARNDPARGPQAKRACGRTVWERTVVVYILDRALLPSQSASQRVLFVSRFKTGYRIWERAH